MVTGELCILIIVYHIERSLPEAVEDICTASNLRVSRSLLSLPRRTHFLPKKQILQYSISLCIENQHRSNHLQPQNTFGSYP